MEPLTKEAFLRLLAQETSGGQSAWATAKGVPPSVVSEVLNGRREPPPALLAVLGLKRLVLYSPREAA